MKWTEYDWEYWVRMKFWDTIEAAFILSGFIPHRFTLREHGFDACSKVSHLEPPTESIYELLKRQFPEEKIAPAECIAWAQKMKINLPQNLELALLDLEIIDSDSSEKPDKKTGEHWLIMRYRIMQRAIKTINDSPEGYRLFKDKDRSITKAQLADAVMEFGHELAYGNGKRIGRDMIYDTIKDAINLKFPPAAPEE